MGDHVLEVAPLETLHSCLVDHTRLLLQEFVALEDCCFISLVCHHHVIAEHYAESTHRDRLAIIERFKGESYYRVALLCCWR